MNKLLLLILTTFNLQLLTFNYGYAQNSKVDSLLTVLKTAKQDTNKVNTINALSKIKMQQGNYDTSLIYAHQAKTLGEQLDFKKGVANSYNNIGIIYYNQGNYPEALKNYFTSLKIKEEIVDKKGIANSYHNIGIIYKNQGNYPEALRNYFASLKIKEEFGDKEGIAASYNNIGIVYHYQGNYPEALKNYFASLKIMEEIGDKKGIAASYNNIGSIYDNQGNYPEALKNHFASLKIMEEIGDKMGIAYSFNNIGIIYAKQGNYPEALKNHFTSLKIMEEIGDKKGIAYSFNYIGNIYSLQGNYPEALKNLYAALKIREEIGDKKGIADSYGNIGNALISMNKAEEGKSWVQKALTLSKEIGAKDVIKNSYSGLAQADSAMATSPQTPLQRRGAYWQSAFENYKLYILYRDSLINEENTKKTMQASMQYEYDKKAAADSVKNAEAQKVKDAQILAQTAQIKQEKTQRYGLYGGLTLVLVFAGFIFNRFRVTRKQKEVIEEQKNEVEKQKELADSRRIIAEEQKEVIAIKNKEIIDSINYAKRIQNAMLTSENYIADELQKLNSEHFILFKPKDIVSGDFYWFYKYESMLYYMTADCTGHGVPGGFMSMLGINLLNEIVIERRITDPGLILDKLREEIIKALTTDEGFTKDGMDGILCKIDYSKNTLEYAASNNAPYIVRNKEILRLQTQKMPIGFAENSMPFETRELQLDSGDTIYTFTDGYADQFGGEKGKKFLNKNLEEKLLAIADMSLREQKEILNDTFENWKGKLEQVDDITIIGLRV